jgi:hypothetical protein
MIDRTTAKNTSPAKTYGRPRPTSLPYLDRNMYRCNTDVISRVDGIGHVLRLQMMAIGERRFLFTNQGDVIDVSDPLRPQMFSRKAYPRGHIQLAFNRQAGKWILVVCAGVPGTNPTPTNPLGKYGDPALIERSLRHPGLRGVRIYDASDPAAIRLLSEWSCDQGDPKRALQTGGGGADAHYDGGRYLYLQASPDETFTVLESPWRSYTYGLQILDIADPAQPKFVANWWMPGQRTDEHADARRWPEFGDRQSTNHLLGSLCMAGRVEEGVHLAYSCWGSLGLLVHDLSDIRQPRLIGRYCPPTPPGAIPFHTVDVLHLARGFVITSPEPLYPDGAEPFHPSRIIDVRDTGNLREIGRLPVPVPPPDAPFSDFLDRRGRFGPHNPPYINSPGRTNPKFTAYAYFNAGLQMFDVSNPEQPAISGYFIPPQAGSYDDPDSHCRDVDAIFVEWDRNLIWVCSLTGMYLIVSPKLGVPILKPARVMEWAQQDVNAGHP